MIFRAIRKGKRSTGHGVGYRAHHIAVRIEDDLARIGAAIDIEGGGAGDGFGGKVEGEIERDMGHAGFQRPGETVRIHRIGGDEYGRDCRRRLAAHRDGQGLAGGQHGDGGEEDCDTGHGWLLWSRPQ